MGLPAHKRLHHRREFERVFAGGERYFYEKIVIYWLDVQEPWNRYGIITSRRLGNAVTRNRIKRCLREVIRSVDRLLAQGCHIIIIPQRNLPTPSFQSMTALLLPALRGSGLLPPAQDSLPVSS